MFNADAKVVGLLVSKKKILKEFTIYGRGGHLGHITGTIYIYHFQEGFI